MLADRYQGKRLNSPNDAVVKSDGSIWFTDPTYGIDSEYEGDAAPSEIGGQPRLSHRSRRRGDLTAVATDFVQAERPRLFARREAALHRRHRRDPCRRTARATSASPTSPPTGARSAPAKLFATCTVGLFDGFRVDTKGNVWTSAGDGVHVYAPDGTLIGKIKVPEVVANVCFGGPKRNRLYICGTTSLYSIYVNARGATWPT